MPQLRSFSSFAGTPGIGAAYVGGSKVGADIVADAARLQVEREKIAQAAVEAGMAHSAKMAALQSQALRDSTELEVKKAYQTQVLGLRERELSQEMEAMTIKAEQAAQEFQRQKEYEKQVLGLKGTELELKAIDSDQEQQKINLDRQESYDARIPPKAFPLDGAPGAMVFKSGKTWNEVNRTATAPEMGPARLEPVEGTDQYDYFQTGRGSRTLVPRKPDASIPPEVQKNFLPGIDRVGNRLVNQREPQELKDLRKERDRLAEAVAGPTGQMAKTAIEMEKQDGKKPASATRAIIKVYEENQSKLDEVNRQIKAFGAPAQASAPSTNRPAFRILGKE